MKVRLKNTGVKVKVNSGLAITGTDKGAMDYPRITLTSAHVDGLDGVMIGKRCKLIAEIEATAVRAPDDYDKGRLGMKGKKGIIADFKVCKAAIVPHGVTPGKGKDYDDPY